MGADDNRQINVDTNSRDESRLKMTEYLYKNETHQIIGVSFELHNQLGGGHKEKVYLNGLTNELKELNFKVEKEKQIPVILNGKKLGVYVPDLVINDIIIIELKAKPFLIKSDIKQFWQYLRGTNYKLGLLINFSPAKVEIKRIIYDKARPAGQSA
jgi:GxxExxY protein